MFLRQAAFFLRRFSQLANRGSSAVGQQRRNFGHEPVLVCAAVFGLVEVPLIHALAQKENGLRVGTVAEQRNRGKQHGHNRRRQTDRPLACVQRVFSLFLKFVRFHSVSQEIQNACSSGSQLPSAANQVQCRCRKRSRRCGFTLSWTSSYFSTLKAPSTSRTTSAASCTAMQPCSRKARVSSSS